MLRTKKKYVPAKVKYGPNMPALHDHEELDELARFRKHHQES